MLMYIHVKALHTLMAKRWHKMKDYTHKRLEASLEVRKQARLDKYLSIGLSTLGALIGIFCIVFATHVALG